MGGKGGGILEGGMGGIRGDVRRCAHRYLIVL